MLARKSLFQGAVALFASSLVLSACSCGEGKPAEQQPDLVLSPAEASVFVGNTAQLTATAGEEDVTTSTEWSSDTPDVASVEGGLVTGLREGVAVITGSREGKNASATITVVARAVTLDSISVDPGEATIPLGTTQAFTATGFYSDGSSKNITEAVTWASSDSSVAELLGGVATARGVGTSSITATLDGVTSGPATLTVGPAIITAIAVAPETASIPKGKTQAFVATATLSDGSTQDISSTATWTSSDQAVATVTAGVATGADLGTVNITASQADVTSAPATLTVTSPVLDSIEVSPASASVAKGLTQAFTALGTYSDGTTQDLTQAATWSTDDAAVATIAAGGLATAVDVGSTDVTATHEGITSPPAVLDVTSAELVSIAVSPSTVTLAKGRTQQLVATATYTDGSTADVSATASWASTDGAVVTVSAGALATAAGVGTADVTATVGLVTSSAASFTVTPAEVDAIAVAPASASVAKGLTQQLTATATYSDGTIGDVTAAAAWSSSDGQVATVSAGTVTGVGQGSADIVATLAGVSSPPASLTVTDAVIQALAITPASSNLAKGQTVQLTVTATFSDGTMGDVSSTATWSSSDDAVASVDGAGLVTAASVGTAQLTASHSGVTSPPAAIDVGPAIVTAISLSPASASVPKGRTEQLTATATYSDGTTADVTSSATWTSSSAAASVSAGLVTAVELGAAEVTATLDGVTSSATAVTVVAPVIDSIALSPSSANPAKGQTVQLTATATYSDGTTGDVSSGATWSSSAEAVATVSGAGLVTAVSVGTTEITASHSGVTSSPASIEVGPAIVTAVTVAPGAVSVPKGRTTQLTATATYSDGTVTVVTGTASWASSTAAASVSASGLVTAESLGSAEVTATVDGVASDPTVITVLAPVIDSIAVSPASASQPKGRTQQLTATATYSDGTTGDVTASAVWSSSDEQVATVVGGLVSADELGSAGITATLSGVTSPPATFTVTAPVIEALAVSPSSTSLAKGQTAQLTVTATYSDGSTADVSSTASWSSSNGPVASVDGAGLVTAASVGSAQITATHSGVTSNAASVAVGPAIVTSVAVAPASVSVPKGRTAQLTATATYSDGSTANVTSSATWASSAAAASVSASGLVTAVSLGRAEVTATVDGVTSSPSEVTVVAPVIDSIAVSPASASLPKGRTQQLTATATYSDGTTGDVTSTASWSSDAAAVTVSATGLATAAAVGTAGVTAEQGAVTSSAATITVTPAVVDSVAVTPATASVPKGLTQQLTATATYSDGTTSNVTTSATWTSSSPTVASVSSSGLATGLLQGTSTLTASFSGKSSSAALTVTAPVLAAISVTPVNRTVPVNFSIQYAATGTWSDGSTSDVTSTVVWSSSASAVASITSGGRATGVGVGTTTLQASQAGVSGATTLHVTSATLTSIAVNPNVSTLPTGGVKLALHATGFFDDGSSLDLTDVATWASSNPVAATVSTTSPTQGLVTSGATAGTTNVTATHLGLTGTAVVTVVAATLNGITVVPTNRLLPVGFGLQYGATGAYSDGNVYDLTLTASWSSSAPAIASVSNSSPTNGYVTALSPGAATITATFAGKSGSTSVTVTGASLVSLSVSPASITRPVGLTVQFSAVALFDDGTTQDLSELVTWSSSAPAVAIVSNAAGSRGLASLLGAGTSTIAASFAGKSATASLTAVTPSLDAVVVTPVNASTGVSGIIQMFASALYSDGTAVDVTDLATWTSSDASVATVRNDPGHQGVVTGAGQGSAVITATFGLRSGSSTVTITNANLVDLYISPAMPHIGVGTTVQFSASGVWSDGTTADLTQYVSWSSSSPGVATLSNVAGSKGLATGVSGGTTVVTVSHGGQTDSTVLTVTAAPMTAITVTPAARTVPLGILVQYTAVATYADGTTQDLTTQVGWSSSAPAVAAISNSTGTKGLATALSGGTTTISALFGAVSGSTTLTVRNVSLVGITVSPANASIPVGFFRQYTAQGLYSDGSTEDLTTQVAWFSSDSGVAVASNAPGAVGRVIGVAAGSATITARLFGVSGSVTANVVAYTLCSIDVTPKDSSAPVGAPVQMTATGLFAATCPPAGPVLSLDITKQVGWRVVPKQHATVSNSPGSEGVATMVDASPPGFGNVQAQIGAFTVGTKLYAQ